MTSAPTAARQHPPRALIILGPTAFLAGVGYIAGWFVTFVCAQSFPDYASFAATGGLVGAGIGWVLGTMIGIRISEGDRKVNRVGAAVLWVTAATAIAAGIVIAAYEDRLLADWILTEAELPWMRRATVADGVIVAVTLVVASFPGRSDDEVVPAGFAAGMAGVLATLLLAAAFVLSVSYVFFDHRGRVEDRAGSSARSTVYDLLREAQSFHDRRGRYPDGLSHVIRIGGEIHPGVLRWRPAPAPVRIVGPLRGGRAGLLSG